MRIGLLTVLTVFSSSAVLSGCGPKVWVQDEQVLTVPAADLEHLEIYTGNGSISASGEVNDETIQVKATLRGGGDNEQSATDCLNAMVLVSRPNGDGVHEVSWKFNEPRRADWATEVSFDVTLPTRLALKLEAHNGSLKVNGVAGALDLDTSNGSIEARDVTAKLEAKTSNGNVEVSTNHPRFDVVSSNGNIIVAAERCTSLDGSVRTSNGGIRVKISPHVNANIVARTTNGEIECELPLRIQKQSSRLYQGTLGQGGSTLTLDTSNGAIDILAASGE